MWLSSKLVHPQKINDWYSLDNQEMEKGSSSASSSAAAAGGLNFGKKIYFEGSAESGGAGTPPSQPKKGRTGVVIGGQPPRCQVEGCNVDLSDAKTYYSRHKVCGMHSKSPRVIVAGLEQRFCQQCSRFHQLPAFDQDKRSCRRRLAGHNERRRKPPPGPSSSPRFGSVSSSSFDNHSKTGGFVMDFSAYPALGARESWPNTTSEQGSGNEATITATYHQIQWQSNSQNHLPQGSTTRPGFSSGPGLSPEEGYGALSLLSTTPWDPRTRGPSSLGVNNFLGTNDATIVQPGQFASASWGFKGDSIQDDNALNEMPPDLGLGQNPQPANDGQYTGDLGLGLPNGGHFQQLEQSRGYDSASSQHMHWSL